MSSGEESNDDNDREGDEPPAKSIFVPTLETRRFLESVSLKPLKNDRRKGTINKYSIPAFDPTHPPKLDESVSCLVPKSAKIFDNFLSKLQRFTLDAMGPLAWFLNEKEQGKEVDIDGAVRASISLLGNALSHFNRRRAVIKHLNKDHRPLADADFPNRGPQLFGDDFGKRAKAMADNVSALKGLQAKKNYGRFSGSGGFNGRFNLSKPQSRHAVWGVTPASANRKSVFGRLDTAPKSFTFPRRNKQQHQKDQNK